MQGYIDTGKGYLRKARDPATALSDASSLVQDANMTGNTAYQLLHEMKGAKAGQIPHQVVNPFQRWATGLAITDSIFFRADLVANYELATIDLRQSILNLNDPADSLIKARDRIKWPFRRLTVPSRAMGMLPHFAIVGHELGHAIQERVRPDFSPFLKDDSDSLARTIARLNAESVGFGPQEILRRQRTRTSWMYEIIADAIGLLLAGPAFHFALGAFFELGGGGLGIAPTHPPSEMRRRLVVEKLKTGTPSHRDVFEAATGLSIEDDVNSPHLVPLPPPDDLYNELRNRIGPIDAAICVELVPFIETVSSEIYDEAERVLRASNPEMVYGPDSLQADLDHHLEALCHLIPPIEHREGGVPVATSLAGILNVGWSALLTRLDRIPVKSQAGADEESSAKMETLQELLLKAVELSEARKVWEAAK